ncbi:lactonase family protein [Sinomonas humi]|uniref:lactonase family protein n=1 Tax=Sinomonas humi TaxID=1338436 RepID=UPI00068CBD03|nr:beta-propeller fold lactonase family protein [Sinomonas humi]
MTEQSMPQRTLVLVACPGAGAVDLLELDAGTGALKALARAEGLPGVAALALDPQGTAYAACNGDGTDGSRPRAVALSLDATGAVAQGAARDLPASACFVALGPDGGSLFSASYGDARLDRVPLPGTEGGKAARYETGANTHCVAFSPDGRFLYATSLGDDRVSWFETAANAETPADDDGAIGPSGSVAAERGSGPRYLRLNRAGDRVYVVHELTGEIGVYARDAESGGLELLQRISAVEGLGLVPGPVRSASTPDPGTGVVWAADLRLTPDERFLYTTERSTSTIAGFAVKDDGTLEFVSRTSTEAQPCGSAIDPSGRFLLVCGEASDHISSYWIGDDGWLTQGSRSETSAGPLAIECYRTL